MSRKAAAALLAIFLLVAASSGVAGATTYYVYDQWGGTWHDANKTGSDDGYMCWAAAASNILDWAGWDTATYNTQTLIFQYLVDHWTNSGSLPEYGWNWWLTGTWPKTPPTWSRVEVLGGGFFSEVVFASIYHEAWSGDLMAAVASFFQSGYGVTLAIYQTGLTYGHALTCWGYDTDENGNYIGIRVTDSDDGVEALMYYTVTWDDDAEVWDLGGILTGYYIGGVEALDRNLAAVPLPPSLLLLGCGLLGLAGWRHGVRKYR